ncbi:MAG: TolC family protein [Treponema sp.]|nr:TolC family protein [Treponema sp.]
MEAVFFKGRLGFLPQFLGLILFIAFPVCLVSQESRTFTLDQAVAWAMENSRTLKSADIDLEIKKRAAQYSWNVFVPTVQASGTLSRQNKINMDSVNSAIDQSNAMIDLSNAVGQMGAAMQNLPYTMTGQEGPATYSNIPHVSKKDETESMHWTALGNLGVSLNLSLAYIEQIKASKSAYEGGLITYEQSRRETATSVKKLFYGLLLQQENIKLQEQSLETARKRSVQARANWDDGKVSELSYLQAYVSYENMKPGVAEARRTLRQQLDTFAFLLGLPVGTKITLSGSVDPSYLELDSDRLIADYGGQAPDVKSLLNTRDNLTHNLKALNLSLAPVLSLNWGAQPMLTNAFDTNWFDADNWSDSGSFSATLAWNLTNLLPFSQTQLQAAELKDNIRKLDISMQTVRENQKMQVRKAVDTANSSREQIQAMSRNIDLAQRSYKAMEQAYQAGTVELLDLRDAESQLNQTRLGLLNQKFNYISALLDLEQLLNIELLETR